MKRLLLSILLVALVGAGVRVWLVTHENADVTTPRAAGTSILKAISGGNFAGYRRITGPESLSFPEDHGAHPETQLEWWYFTGNLADDDGRRLGFQLTFFRTGLSPHAAKRASPWAAQATYMAHFALTDGEGKRFFADDRFARAALGLAGATAVPFRVWTESWSATSTSLGEDPFPLRLEARTDDVAIDLLLTKSKPRVLQGDAGYSRKGADPGNASQYVSFTRLPAVGTITLDGVQRAVSGTAWMDHEWSTSVLAEGIAGWDWFSIQLDDGRDLMIYSLRLHDGTPGPFSHAALIDEHGGVTEVPFKDVKLGVTDSWTSPHTGVRYPSRFRIELPFEPHVLLVSPLMKDQEIRVAVTYWEGAVLVTGPGGELLGRGYTELVGYAEDQ